MENLQVRPRTRKVNGGRFCVSAELNMTTLASHTLTDYYRVSYSATGVSSFNCTLLSPYAIDA
jgi:hypothetical protein